jgi:hypothetical protein
MKYFLLTILLFSGLFAHGEASNHIHFFNNWHLEHYLLLIVGLISAYTLYNKVFKENL